MTEGTKPAKRARRAWPVHYYDEGWSGYVPTKEERERCGGRKVAVISARHPGGDPLGRDLFTVEIPQTGQAMIMVRLPKAVAHKLAGEACCLHDRDNRCLKGHRLSELDERGRLPVGGHVRRSRKRQQKQSVSAPSSGVRRASGDG